MPASSISLGSASSSRLPWIKTIPGVPYFQTEEGQPWHPIGQNDAVSWRELNPLFRRKNVPVVEEYLAMLAAHGVTCMRLMIEYAQVRHRYFETATGVWSPNMVQFWDDLFALCEKHGLRILLTPFDTFWMWLHFKHHPYNQKNGGSLSHPSRALLCRETREAIKARLTFAAERWGGSGALFAWDVWNEIHPAQAEMSAEPFVEFIEDLSSHLRAVEMRRFGRAHPQTVSLFGPELKWRAEMQMEPAIYRHPSLEFATIHIYEHGTIDDPKNTVDAACGMGRVVKQALGEIHDTRPFFDSEHGPIHSFKDHHKTLPEPFDDEYFRHMQWAHLASGGAGGGMRWPNRKPHSLTPGMHVAQRGLAGFLPQMDWLRFKRVNVSEALRILNDADRVVTSRQVARFGCASDEQAAVYLLRRDTLLKNGMLDLQAPALAMSIEVPGLKPGRYDVIAWDTVKGELLGSTKQDLSAPGAKNRLTVPPLIGEIALAIRREA
ncbi:MAG: hypothetical protein ACRYFU_04905 [Janthinobacterium lividum]